LTEEHRRKELPNLSISWRLLEIDEITWEGSNVMNMKDILGNEGLLHVGQSVEKHASSTENTCTAAVLFFVWPYKAIALNCLHTAKII